MVITNSGRIIRNSGYVIGGSVWLEFTGRSKTFPFAITNNSAVNNGVGNLWMQFNRQTSITVDYGDGTVKTYTSSVLPGETIHKFCFNCNDYFSQLYTQYHPVYVYPDGELKPRTVKISYDRSALTSYSGGIAGVATYPMLNFLFYAHRNLTTFSTSGAQGVIVDIAELGRISPSTNPYLTTLLIYNWAATSPYVGSIPIQFLNMPLLSLGTGSASFTDTSGTNLEYLGTMPIKNSLTTLSLQSILNVTALPDSLAGLTKLQRLNLQACAFDEFPMVITRLSELIGLNISQGSSSKTGLTQIPPEIANLKKLQSLTLSYTNISRIPDNVNFCNAATLNSLTVAGTTTLTEFGDISNLVNIAFLIFSNASLHNVMTVFPAYMNSFTKLRNINWNQGNNTTASVTDKKMSLNYDLVMRNNTPRTGTNNGSIPFRGMTFNLLTGSATPTAFTGAIEAPPGFVLGVNDGEVQHTGHKIYVLRNNYGATVSLSV